MQTSGNLIVDGLVQIVVAHVNRNPIEADKVAPFMKSVNATLIECIQEAAAALSNDIVTPRAAQPQLARSAAEPVAPRAQLPSPAAAPVAPAPEKAPETVPAAAARTAAPVKKDAAAKMTASKETAKETAKASAPVAPEPAAEAVVEKPAAETTSAADRFAHLPKTPAVPIDASITPNGIICLFDGESRKMLHRHIRAKYNMSPEEYRSYWKLPGDYPMTAPGYSEEKRVVAVAQGLGQSRIKAPATPKKGKAASATRQRQSA